MNRYFDFPDMKCTLCVAMLKGSAAATATPEQIRDHFKQKGEVREVGVREYTRLTGVYTSDRKKEDDHANG